MLYGQIIAWTAVVYVAILAILSILYLIVKVRSDCPKSLTTLFVGLIVCLVVMFETFILATLYVIVDYLQPLAILFVGAVLFCWTTWIITIFFDAFDF